MSSAMNKLNNALFKAEHKSHYSKQDVDILDEYRTVVPVGMMKSVYDKVEQDKIKCNIYEFQKLIFSYEQSVKRTHNPKDETEQEYKNKLLVLQIVFTYGKLKSKNYKIKLRLIMCLVLVI